MQVREKTVNALFVAGIVTLGLVAATILLTVMSWKPNFTVSLPNGYKLVQFSGSDVGLGNPQMGLTVSPVIDGYSVVGDLVVGHVRKGRSGWASVPGYFVLDTSNGAVHSGLTKKRWKSLLLDYGVRQVPSLRRPTG